jgi:restriction endonuclease-like protein
VLKRVQKGRDRESESLRIEFLCILSRRSSKDRNAKRRRFTVEPSPSNCGQDKIRHMSFAERETERVYRLRSQLFDVAAYPPPQDRDHLPPDCAEQNVYHGFRREAAAFFDDRQISRHARGWDNSVTSSQVACVNFLFPGVKDPDVLLRCFKARFPSAKEFLPITADVPLSDGTFPYVSFEWIGAKNYLNEPGLRSRGQFVTNADAILRFRARNGAIHVVLIEWKYRECYTTRCTQYSKHHTDRLSIYAPHVRAGCQLTLRSADLADLLFDPFDQLMRLQLLASAMEREHEMEADTVSVLLIAPCANRELHDNITASNLRHFGASVPAVWSRLVQPGRFRCHPVEKLVKSVEGCSAHKGWARYLLLRYGGMR